MIDLEETFIYDSVVHAYNLAPSNYRNERYAEGIAEQLYGSVAVASPEGYGVTYEGYVRDWGIEETARMIFEESPTDMATFQATPINAFHDGLTSVEKTKRIKQQWPNRFKTFAAVDPLEGEDAIVDLQRQADELEDCVGVKFYPSSWGTEDHKSWRMNDPEVAYPVFEEAKSLGLDVIAVHKAIPMGPVPRGPYGVEDVDQAAADFPEMKFEIVHGGVSFADDTAWQLLRFPNVYINWEAFPIMLLGNERSFAEMLAEMISIGGNDLLDRMFWSSSAMGAHPLPQLEAFAKLEFPQDILEEKGLFAPIQQITDEDKRGILGENYADFVGLDIEKARNRIEGDEFDQRVEQNGYADPFQTTEAADQVV
jgi:predicted TIM-barrel fold metal-dependent hydrolase